MKEVSYSIHVAARKSKNDGNTIHLIEKLDEVDILHNQICNFGENVKKWKILYGRATVDIFKTTFSTVDKRLIGTKDSY